MIVVVAASGELPSLALVGVSVAVALAVDFLDHAIYQIRFGRSDPGLRAAWITLFGGHFQESISKFKDIEDRREINRLIIHSRGGLLVTTILGIIATLYYQNSWVAAAAMSAILALHSDVLWDWRSVGHANNWFGRASMLRTDSDDFAKSQIKSFWAWWPLVHVMGLFPACYLFLLEGAGDRDTAPAYMFVFFPLSIIAACFIGVVSVMLAIQAQAGTRSQSFNFFSQSWRSYVDSAPTSMLFYTKKARLTATYNWVVANHVVALIATAVLIAITMSASAALIPSTVASIKVPLLGFEILNIVAVLVVLLFSLACGYLVHSTAGFLGGCAGAGLGTIFIISLPPTRDILYENYTVLTGAMLAALVSWICGLIFLRIPGAVRTSASLLILTPERTEDIPTVIESLRELSAAELRKNAALLSNSTIDLSTIERPKLRYSVMVDGEDVLSMTQRGETFEIAVKYEPRRLQLGVLHSTFHRDKADWKPQLLPRANAANDLSEDQYVSEILDNILTNSAYLVVQIHLYEAGPQVKIVCRCFEQTTTKNYATKYSRSVVQSIASVLQISPLVLQVSYSDIEGPRCPYPSSGDRFSAKTKPVAALADLPTIAAEASELGTVRRHAGRRLGLTLIAQVASVAAAALRLSESFRR